jgi:hypothetical protein
MAPPVSWAMTRRFMAMPEFGRVVARKTGEPSGTERGSMAMLRSAVSGTPRAPIGPSWLFGTSRKKT